MKLKNWLAAWSRQASGRVTQRVRSRARTGAEIQVLEPRLVLTPDTARLAGIWFAREAALSDTQSIIDALRRPLMSASDVIPAATSGRS